MILQVRNTSRPAAVGRDGTEDMVTLGSSFEGLGLWPDQYSEVQVEMMPILIDQFL